MGIYSLNIGKSAEKAACVYLKKNGYKLLKTNYRSKFGEIDIIAKDKDVLCFIEVKYRKNTDFGFPEDFVHNKKQKKIIKTAFDYIMKNRLDDINLRFDIVTVLTDEKKNFKFKLIKNGFEANNAGF